MLRAHKRAQAALKLKNRTVYADFNMVFAKEHEHLQTPRAALGQPIKPALAERDFQRLVKTADVRRIRFHAVRHTTATLLLQAGVPVHDVSARLGHASAAMTLDVYAHALGSAQADAAARLGGVLHG
jgi:integrase